MISMCVRGYVCTVFVLGAVNEPLESFWGPRGSVLSAHLLCARLGIEGSERSMFGFLKLRLQHGHCGNGWG